MDAHIGFDSGWLDNGKALGAICSIERDCNREVRFVPPQLVNFAQAASFIAEYRSRSGMTLVAIDQPTIVRNAKSMRPVERVAASLVSWLGGGVQPANRSRLGMFCDDAPIWRFLEEIGAIQDPMAARTVSDGLYLIEVFPAISMPAFSAQFYGRLKAPKYNPARKKTFNMGDWRVVSLAVASQAARMGCPAVASYAAATSEILKPGKSDQDRLDAVICSLIALWWRQAEVGQVIMLGDLDTGYMIVPCTQLVKDHLAKIMKVTD